jgi:hypothetical protein
MHLDIIKGPPHHQLMRKKNSSNMFWCNHHHQGEHYLSLLKLQLLNQSIKIHQCGSSGGGAGNEATTRPDFCD